MICWKSSWHLGYSFTYLITWKKTTTTTTVKSGKPSSLLLQIACLCSTTVGNSERITGNVEVRKSPRTGNSKGKYGSKQPKEHLVDHCRWTMRIQPMLVWERGIGARKRARQSASMRAAERDNIGTVISFFQHVIFLLQSYAWMQLIYAYGPQRKDWKPNNLQHSRTDTFHPGKSSQRLITRRCWCLMGR